MVSVQSHKSTEKGLNQACYGGSSLGQKLMDMGSWGNKRESKYQRAQTQSSYANAMAYETEFNYPNPNHEISYGMAEFPGAHNNTHLYGNAMSKTKFNGYGGNGMAQAQTHGHGYESGKRQNQAFGYGCGPAPRNHKQSGTGYGFGSHTDHDYQRSEAYSYGYEAFEENYTNNSGMGQRQPSHIGNGFMKTQAYGPKKNMGYETEAHRYSQAEARYSNESHYGGGHSYHAGKGSPFYGGSTVSHGKNIGDHSANGFIRNESCSEDSDSDVDDFGRSKVWVKAL